MTTDFFLDRYGNLINVSHVKMIGAEGMGNSGMWLVMVYFIDGEKCHIEHGLESREDAKEYILQIANAFDAVEIR